MRLLSQRKVMVVLLLAQWLVPAESLRPRGPPLPLSLLLLSLFLSLLRNYCSATPLPTGELSKTTPWPLLILSRGAPRG